MVGVEGLTFRGASITAARCKEISPCRLLHRDAHYVGSLPLEAYGSGLRVGCRRLPAGVACLVKPHAATAVSAQC